MTIPAWALQKINKCINEKSISLKLDGSNQEEFLSEIPEVVYTLTVTSP